MLLHRGVSTDDDRRASATRSRSRLRERPRRERERARTTRTVEPRAAPPARRARPAESPFRPRRNDVRRGPARRGEARRTAPRRVPSTHGAQEPTRETRWRRGHTRATGERERNSERVGREHAAPPRGAACAAAPDERRRPGPARERCVADRREATDERAGSIATREQRARRSPDWSVASAMRTGNGERQRAVTRARRRAAGGASAAYRQCVPRNPAREQPGSPPAERNRAPVVPKRFYV